MRISLLEPESWYVGFLRRWIEKVDVVAHNSRRLAGVHMRGSELIVIHFQAPIRYHLTRVVLKGVCREIASYHEDADALMAHGTERTDFCGE